MTLMDSLFSMLGWYVTFGTEQEINSISLVELSVLSSSSNNVYCTQPKTRERDRGYFTVMALFRPKEANNLGFAGDAGNHIIINVYTSRQVS